MPADVTRDLIKLGRCLLLCLLLTPWLSAAEPTWRVGVARVNITPDEPLWMAGYASRTHEAVGTFCELWVRACALEDPDGERNVLVSLDLVGMDRTLSQLICQAVSAQTGLRRSQLALCFSHTHSGPVVGRNLEPLHYRQLDAAQQGRIDRYADRLRQQVVDAVRQALDQLQPAELWWGTGRATFAANRRQNAESDITRLREMGQVQGPSDHDVPVLAARNPDGTWRAVWFGYACHATVLDDYSWCGDYPGYAAQELESNQANCVALFWAGCGADQNPLPRRRLELAQQYGAQLAQGVAQVLAVPAGLQPVRGGLRSGYAELPLPLDRVPTADQVRQAAESADRYERARAALQLEQLATGQALPATYPYPIQVWRLGDQVQFIFLGGEVVVDYALTLKSALRGRATWVAGYANDVMAYIPSRRVLAEGGYEGGGAMVYYGLPGPWSPDVERLIVDAVVGLERSLEDQHAVDGGEAVDGGAGVDPHVGQGVRLP
ncbi:MAG: neutral/alkaline non-lysosomal ceramidase N-terminal domain-containing protein [Pirellulaceae bacterium]|jgi:hypothetical protein|nr:neutral/alkaline non-lysosomal ceramidase N-terminal domain-containing protein [Pirellulaceae bacterium]